MSRQDEFARAWTYRTPMVTVTYPKGWSGTLSTECRLAAQKAGALVKPAPKPRTQRAIKKAAE